MKVEKYYKSIALEQQENILTKYTGQIIKNLRQGIIIAEQFHSKINVDDNTLSNRLEIAKISEEFHKNANTLTDGVRQSLELLSDRDTIIIESAHQPSLFPYSGTMIKPVLVHLIAENLRSEGLSVVEVFDLLDTDDTKTGWHRRTELPDIDSKDGILVIRKDTPSKKLIFNLTPAPTLEEIIKWKDLLINWIKQNRKAVNKIARLIQDDSIIDSGEESFFFEQIKEIFNLLKDIQVRADSYGTFNSFFLTQIVNNNWDYPTVFVPYSSSIHVFEKEAKKLIENNKEYIVSHNKQRKIIEQYVDINFNEISPDNFPFWYICKCGIKIRLAINNGTINGECEDCGEKIIFNINKIRDHSAKFSPQAISRHLIFFEGLRPTIYVSGWGAMPFTLVAKGIADDLDFYFPSIIPFRMNQQHSGIGKLRALLEIKHRSISNSKIEDEIAHLEMKSKTLKEGKNFAEYKRIIKEKNDLIAIKNAFNCYPSILDYWINFGIKEIKNEWEEFIKTNEFLSV